MQLKLWIWAGLLAPLLVLAGFFAPAQLQAANPEALPRAAATPEIAPLRERFKPQPGDRVTYVKPGVIRIARTVSEEPWRINLLLFDMTAPEFDVQTAVGDGWLSGRTRTTYLVEQNQALAGINGDLFSGDGIPQGLTMIDGKVAIAPKHRATFAWSNDGEPFIGYFVRDWTWDASVTAANGEVMKLQLLNWPCDTGWVCLFNEFAQVVPALPGDVKVLVGADGAAYRIVEEKAVKVPPGVQVLRGTGKGARWLLENIEVGDTVTIQTRTSPTLDDYAQAISGGPILLKEGQMVQDCLCTLRDCTVARERGPAEAGRPYRELFEGPLCEDFDFDWKMSHYLWKLMPRTAIGFDQQRQTLIAAVVDGYQPGFSRGMTQEELAELMLEFGAYEAMELDGGGSATMVLGDQVLNHPSDDTGERYVANSLLFFWNETRTPPQVAPPGRAE